MMSSSIGLERKLLADGQFAAALDIWRRIADRLPRGSAVERAFSLREAAINAAKAKRLGAVREVVCRGGGKRSSKRSRRHGIDGDRTRR